MTGMPASRLAFDNVLMAAGARVIRSAVQAPRMYSIMETLDRQPSARTARPDVDLEPAPPDDRAARVRGLLQHASAAPVLEAGSTDTPATRNRHRPRSFPGPATRPRRGP